MSLLSSAGIKRYIASLIVTVSGIASTVPALAIYVPVLNAVAAALGAAGVAHAAVKGTVSTKLMSSFTSVLAVLLAATQYVPQLAPYAALIQFIATFFGVATVARGV